jgi:hypothetical protein
MFGVEQMFGSEQIKRQRKTPGLRPDEKLQINRLKQLLIPYHA